ncbi:putative transcription factor FAR family [Helianthus annuus]|nr:putative transcription factor FAR family [Helianthus annuus]
MSGFSTDQVFKSREELMEWVRNTGRSLGYAIVTKRSKAKNGYVSKVVLMCDRGGVYKSDKDSSRETGTRKINCPFEMVGKFSKKNGSWTLKVKPGEHNHPPGEYMEGHPILKRLTPNEHQLVADLTGKGVFPKDILGVIKERDENNVSTIKNIYNARDKKIFWALNCLKSTLDERSMQQPRVIVTDRELALMNACEKVFPNATRLLCRWHVSQSIFRNCKSFFATDHEWKIFNTMWNALVESQTWTSFLQNYKQLQSMLIHHQDVLDYLNSTWLNKYKEMFVSVWTNECLHFGNQTTNRAESQHAKLKKFLNSANCTLDKIVRHIDEVVNSQYTIVKDSFEKSRTVLMHKHNLPMLKLLHGWKVLNKTSIIDPCLERKVYYKS